MLEQAVYHSLLNMKGGDRVLAVTSYLFLLYTHSRQYFYIVHLCDTSSTFERFIGNCNGSYLVQSLVPDRQYCNLGRKKRGETRVKVIRSHPVKPLAGLTQCDGGCLPLRATRSINTHKAVFRMMPPRLSLIPGGVREKLYVHGSMANIERLYQRHEYDVIITSVWQKPFAERSKGAAGALVGLLEAKMKARYLRKLVYIRNEDPYVLNTSDLCKDVSRLPALG